MSWKKFNALGTEVVISAFLGAGWENLLEEAERAIFDFEKRFSRFREDSELSRFNRAPAGEFAVSREMIDILKEAKELYRETGGVFDPTIIGSLERVGYRRSFGEIKDGAGEQDSGEPIDPEEIKREFLARPKLDELEILDGKVRKPEGFKLDLGGIGKGYVADLVGSEIFANVPDFWVSVGGDLIIKGDNEGEIGWKVGVQDPGAPEKEIFSLKTKGQELGVATSGIFKRRGEAGGLKWHHLIDPRTGLPVENEILAVTGISSSATRADVFAKTVLVLGRVDGLKFIDEREDSACIIFLKNGEAVLSQRASDYF